MDTTDGTTLVPPSGDPPATVTFVPPAANGAQIYGGPAQVNNDGTSQATITVYLENGLGQPAAGKTVTLSEDAGQSVITPQGSSTPGTTAVTNSAGNAVFTATDTNAEGVDFTATDTTDGNLPVPGSVSVSFAPNSATCSTTLPTPASGTSVSAFATGVSYNTESEVFPGNFTLPACTTGSAPAFDSSGNAYIADTNDGTIHVLPPSGGALSLANQLPDASFPPDTIGQLVFAPDGSLYAGLINGSTDVSNPEIVQLNPATGATIRVVASAATGLPDCPYIMAVDPLSGDLFADDECSGYAGSNQISRISDPTGASPTVTDYITTGGCNLGMAFAPNGTLYLANCNGEVDSIGGTNTTSPTVTTVASVSGTPFAVAVTGANASGQATTLDVFGNNGDVTSVDLTQSPAVTSTIATGTSFFYITASSANGCAYGTIPGSVVRIGPPSCASSPTTSQGPELELSGPSNSNPSTGSSDAFTAKLTNVTSPAGTPIEFIVEGANPQVDLESANSSGSATFTYTALHPGTDTVVAAVPPLNESSVHSARDSVTWTAGKDTAALSLNQSQGSGPVGTPATFAGDVADISTLPPVAIAGASVIVTVGTQSCTFVTGSAGSGSCQVTPTSAGLLPVGAAYSGSSNYTSAFDHSSFFAGGPSTTAPTPTLTSIAVTPANPSITKGATEQFTATGTYSDKSTANLTSQVTWTSGTTTVATIATGGLATGVGAGSSTITATLGAVSGTTKLTVSTPTLTSIAVTPANPSITKGATEQFTATGTYSDKSTANLTSQVTWTSGTTTVATITTGGLATGVGAGSSTITATLGAVSGSTKLTVAAPTLTSIAVTPANPSITKGGTEQFTATGTYSDKSTANLTSQVTWTRGTTAVATVTTGGLATGVGAGSSTITASLGGVSGSTKLTVTAPTLTSIAVTPANPSITKGATEQFTATGTYSDKSTANLTSQVTWTSGTTTVATITAGGLATGVGAGSSTITAALGGVSGSTKLTVAALPVTLDFTGSISYLNAGSLTSGGFIATVANGTITSVNGTGTIPGLKGGSATVTITIHRSWLDWGGHHQFYVGAISVYDPGAHLFTTALVVTSALTQVSATELSGVAHGLSPDWKNVTYTLDWSLPVKEVSAGPPGHEAVRVARSTIRKTK